MKGASFTQNVRERDGASRVGLPLHVLAAAALILALSAALAIPAALAALFAVQGAYASPAASGGILIVAQEEAHSYDAYRLFSCTVNEDGAISDVSTAGCMPAGFYDEAFESSDPQDMADEAAASAQGAEASSYVVGLSEMAASWAGEAQVTELRTGERAVLSPGVYLFVCRDAQPIVAVVGGKDVEVSEKSTVPAVMLEVGERTNDSTGKISVSYGSEATAGASKPVPYRITGTLPLNYASFDVYPYAMSVKMDACLAPDASSIVVTRISDGTGEAVPVAGGYSASVEGGVLRVAFGDLKDAVPDMAYGDLLVVTYNAKLDAQTALCGFRTGNLGTATLDYPRSPSYEETGTSAPSQTKVYTFRLDVDTKDASAGTSIPGATYVLKDGNGDTVAEGVADENGRVSFRGLDEGSFSLIQTKVPDGYTLNGNPIPVIISANMQDKTLTVKVASNMAYVQDVDAQEGNATIPIALEKKAEASVTGGLAVTGDAGMAYVLTATGATLCALAIASFSRKRRSGCRET